MDLIELDDCFVQPRAILKFSAEKEFNLQKAEAGGHDYDDLWDPVIKVTLVGDEKRTMRFFDEKQRNDKFIEMRGQMEDSK